MPPNGMAFSCRKRAAQASIKKRAILRAKRSTATSHALWSLLTRETVLVSAFSAILLVRQKLRPDTALERASPHCNMVPDHVRLLYWWHLRPPPMTPITKLVFLVIGLAHLLPYLIGR